MNVSRSAALAARLVAGLSVTASAPAPHAGGPAHGAPAAPADLPGDLPAHFAGITLTSAQRAQIVAAQRRYHAQMDAVRDSARAAGKPVDQARLQALMAEEHAAFRQQLTPGQQAAFDANMKSHAPAHGAPAKAAPAHGAHDAHGAHGQAPAAAKP